MFNHAITAPLPDGLKTGYWAWARTAMDGSDPHVQVFLQGYTAIIPCTSVEEATELLDKLLRP